MNAPQQPSIAGMTLAEFHEHDHTVSLFLEGHEQRALLRCVEAARQRADGAGDYELRAELDQLRDTLDAAERIS